MQANADHTPVFAEGAPRDDFSADRIRWLISLRWVAMAGVLVATLFVLAGFFPGVAWPVFVLVAEFWTGIAVTDWSAGLLPS